ncbi:hypothetical protein [Blautia argi]|uniref:hypothetical protein n=1 Tax=Blautia argi TaxID=1912897 RepID=UPI0029428221|nr:hypothetical protein [Blautia argi]
MEYVQMTLDDWLQVKQKLRQELLGVKQSFVRIGYALRKIEDQKLYEQDGYKNITEFAKAEYGLEASTTSRFMSINREYSVDGYSQTLRPEYEDLGRSQLEEMLKLPESDRQMVQQETSREDIRELKRFNKTAPETGVADDLQKLIEEFFKDYPETLNAVFSVPAFEESNIKGFVEIVNPGGNRSYKKGLFFLMMYENRITVKKFGGTPKDMTWWEFYQQVLGIFESSAAGNETWQNYFGGEEAPKKEEEELPEQETSIQPETEKPAQKEEKKEEVAPAQKSKEPSVEKKEPVVRNTKEGKDHKQEEEETVEETSEAATEIMEKPFGNRKDYIDSLTAYGMACYLVEEYQNKSFQLSFLDNRAKLEEWLKEPVDCKGYVMEEDTSIPGR